MYSDDPYAQAGRPGPFSPLGPVKGTQAGKPAPQPTPTSRYGPYAAAAQAYGERQRPGMSGPRPQMGPGAFYGQPARRPMISRMGYGGGYGGHMEPDPDQWGGASDMDADNMGGGYGRPRMRRPGFGGVSPQDPYGNGGGY